MKLRLFNAEGKVSEIEVDPSSDTVETVCVLAEIEFGIPVAAQRLAWGTVPISNINLSAPLSQYSFRDNDPIQITRAAVAPPVAPAPAPAPKLPAAAAAVAPAGGGGGGDQELLRLFGAPAPAARPQQQQQQQQQQQPAAGGGDEALLRLFEQSAINENLTLALEMTPEAFGTVTMLYVQASANGHKMPAFVDSGAQMTIMSEKCAEKCNLTRLIDRRHQGEARGVGRTKIVGVVHLAVVTIAGLALPMRITILEADNMDFLLGLDQLRGHRMSIDLAANPACLRIGGEGDHSTPFLSEHELPENLRQNYGGAPGDDSSMGHRESSTDAARNAAASAANINRQLAARSQAAEHGGGGAASSQTSSDAAPGADLTAEQREKVQNLVSLLGCQPAMALQALVATEWDMDAAAAIVME